MAIRATRLLHLLDALRGRRRPVPGAELATALGISLRTLYRDIATLRVQGADILGDPGVGYVLRPGFLLPALNFSEDELEALTLGARWVARQADPELAQAAQRAVARIAATLPGTLRLSIETSGLLVPDANANAVPPLPPAPWLPVLRRGIRLEHVLRMDYADAGGNASQRRIWPFAMAFLGGYGVIAAWCELRGDFRHFRADRVLALADDGERHPSRRHLLIKRWRAATGYGGSDC
ncbi:helix-turn-helix transcriptional regulator [Xanthomonas bundabergensis]|uniref:helix-turn-helix transcriptional regulator n=1 Tax=Xanthomonas bundabergensis TaxID=3160842 RepID=UPI003518A5A0